MSDSAESPQPYPWEEGLTGEQLIPLGYLTMLTRTLLDSMVDPHRILAAIYNTFLQHTNETDPPWREDLPALLRMMQRDIDTLSAMVELDGGQEDVH